MSFGFWALIAVAGSVTMYQFDRLRGFPVNFRSMIALQLSQTLTYAPLTPVVLALARRYPVREVFWVVVLYFIRGSPRFFTLAHVALRGLTYPVWDIGIRGYASDGAPVRTCSGSDGICLSPSFSQNVIDDMTGTYMPIVLIAHVVSYYQRFRERELRSSQLQTQLAKSQSADVKEPASAPFPL